MYVIQKLRRSGVIAMADLDSGGCGGADRSYFVVDRQFFFDSGSFSQAKFEQYIDERLKGFAQTDKQKRIVGLPARTAKGDARQCAALSVVIPDQDVRRVRNYPASAGLVGQLFGELRGAAS